MLQQLEHKPFRGNPYFEQYVDLLISLHDAMRHDDEDEAERLREKMDEPGLHLNADEIQWVKGLSSDLYMLDGDEDFRPLDRSPSQLLADIRTATERSNGNTMLQLLRRANFVSAEHRAWFRSRAYGMLGYYSLSIRFLAHAFDLAPERVEYSHMMLVKLVQQGDFSHARQTALHLLELPDQPPELRIISAIALCASTEDLSSEEAHPFLVQAVQVISSLLAAEQQGPLPVDESRVAWMVLAEAYSKLGETANAVRASRLGMGGRPEGNRLTLVSEVAERLSALETSSTADKSADITSQSLSLLGAYSQQSVNQFMERILSEDYAAAA